MQLLLAMGKRHFWFEAPDEAWRRRPVVWLSGVRRSGKTTLARALHAGWPTQAGSRRGRGWTY